MNIGIIDSGVLMEYINGKVDIVENLDFSDSMKIETSRFNGTMHGTLVLNTIEKYSLKKNKYYICNIIGNNTGGTAGAVLRSLKYLQSKRELQVIIMSLCIKKQNREINRILHQLKKQGVIIFAAQENMGMSGFPASDYSVIGVGKETYSFDSSFTYYKKALIQVKTNAHPEFVMMGQNNYQMFFGTSKAVPLFATMVMNQLNEEHWNSGEIITFIQNNKRTHAQLRKQYYHVQKKRNKNEEMYWWVWKYINSFRYSRNQEKIAIKQPDYDLPIWSIVSQISDVLELIEYISKKAKIQIEYEKLLFKDFCTIGALVEYIENQKVKMR
jgi:hypothetical protein